MTVTINFDVSLETDAFDDEVRAIVRKHGGTIVYYRRSGPGGGNPTYGVEAADEGAAKAIIDEMYGDTDGDYEHYFVPNGSFDHPAPRTKGTGLEHVTV